jgi:hypothetical protein
MSAYTIQGNQVFRGEDHVADIDDAGKATATKGNENYINAVTRYINENKSHEQSEPEQAEVSPKAKSAKSAKSKIHPDDNAPDNYKERQRIAKERKAEIKERIYEDAPRMDPTMGDKDPKFMEWLKENYPSDYAIRYEGRIVPKDQADADYGAKNALNPDTKNAELRT